MSDRLAEYFVVIGFDHQKQRGGVSTGKVIQGFPEKEWNESPWADSIAMFCQPQSWRLATKHQQPSFFMFVITDELAVKRYCGCLVFHESISAHPLKHDDDDIDDESLNSMDLSYSTFIGNPVIKGDYNQKSNVVHQIMYAPKCLLLISRHNYPEILKNCLTVIYTVYIDNYDVKIENLVSTILAEIEVPPPGGSTITFSLGAGDKQVLRSPLSSTIPITSTCVYELFAQLGIYSVVSIVVALMTENKVLVMSRSYTQIYNSCHALISLIYPFEYSHIYIPILPADLVDFIASPTPYLMGVHSSMKSQTTELNDVVVVDLDEGSVKIPNGLLITNFDEDLNSQLINHLCLVLRPQLSQADDAFSPSQSVQSSPQILDKEIRAIFLRIFTQLLQGYRSCLTVSRIYPKPIITFNKASFLSQRNFVNNEFVLRLLDCIFFNTFVQERGIPFRSCDLFDDLYSSLHNFIKEEYKNPDLTLKHIKELAHQLYLNESLPNSSNSNLQAKIPMPTEGAFTRVHLPSFPLLDQGYIQELFETERIKRELHSVDKSKSKNLQNQRIVPLGLPISCYNEMIGIQNISLNSARRLEVMRRCINSIFENKILDARKTLNAVLRALRNKHARLALCEELSNHVIGCKAVLEHEQFDLVVRLMNCALQDNSEIDINEIAAAIVPLALKFCRRLSTNVIQFAYTCIQDHPVWSNMQFWEQTFYLDVEKDIRNLYSTEVKQNVKLPEIDISKQFSEFVLKESALEIAAKQMRLYDKLDKSSIKEYIRQENDTIYAQAVHYANNIVAFRIPFDISNKDSSCSVKHNTDDDTNSITNQSNAFDESGATQSIANDNESVFDEDSNVYSNTSSTDVANNVIKFIFRFIDKVCNDSGVPQESIKRFNELIPSVVSMQIESLEPVWRESRHLPPLPKPKILIPHTLPGEELSINELRAYLINDGKDESRTGVVSGTQFLPAEGAIFITNYRVIFKGRPMDPYASESIIVRSFPISSIIKEKRVTVSTIASLIDRYLPEGLQIKSNTFQVIKIVFDDEVQSDLIEHFRKLLQKEHAPDIIFDHFAFTSQLGVSHSKQRKIKEKKTFQGMAKKTLLRTAEKAGFKTKNMKTKNKYKDMNGFYTMMGGGGSQKYFSEEKDGENMSSSIDNLASHATSTISSLQSDNKSYHRLHEMLYVKDYERMGFTNYSHLYIVSVTGSKTSKLTTQSMVHSLSANYNDQFKITAVNMHYSVCATYPGLIVMPTKTSEETIKKISRCYRQNRFPAIVWKHPLTRALLLRSSASNSKSMIGLFKPQNSNTNNSNSTQMFSSNYFDPQTEHENFIKLLSSFTVSNNRNSYIQRLSDIENSSVNSYSTNSPDSYRRHPHLSSMLTKTGGTFNRALNTLRTSGGKSTIGSTMGRQLQKWSNNAIGKEHRSKNLNVPSNSNQAKKNSFILLDSNDASLLSVPASLNSSNSYTSLNGQNFVPLYIIGEKNHFVKSHETSCSYEFIPIELHEVRHIKSSFKKVLKVCSPSEMKNTDNPYPSTFFKEFVNTDWLKQLQKIMEVSALIVDLVDIRGSSVLLCLEDGNDLVAQIISIAELCLDPYYRTFEGFRTLIEKEWLAFGHRFVHRSNLNAASASSGFAPVFLQFLDVVHQIHSQFPLSFEFNQYFIKFLAYHYVSCRFRTFLQDCEADRSKFGWIDEDIKLNLTLKKLMTEEEEEEDDDPSDSEISMTKSNSSMLNTSSNKNSSNTGKSNGNTVNYTGTSFWDYCVRIWAKSPIFYNFYYVPIISVEGHFTDAAVLRPQTSMASMKIWDYYVGEELAHGPSYDLEVMQMEKHRGEEIEINRDYEKTGNRRIIVNAIYDSVDHVLPNCFIQMLDQIKLLEGELNCTSQKWLKIWNKIEIPLTSDFESMQISQQRLLRKMNSNSVIHTPLDVMTSYSKGLLNLNYLSQVKTFASHNFEVFTPNTLSKCDYCSLLIGIRTGFRCSECDLCCHEHCRENVAKLCRPNKKKPLAKLANTTTTTNIEDNTQNNNCDSKGLRSDSDSEIETPVEPNNDYTLTNRKRDSCNFKGYLFKKGALLKSWKQRWFVLDTTQHQLKYYDSEHDQHYKGYIDLGDVVSVTPIDSLSFELQLTKRTCNFMAPDMKTAAEWVEKISACLQ